MPSAPDFRPTAERIIHAAGGTANILSHSHCASRLRLQLLDDSLINPAALDGDALIKGHFLSGKEWQIVIGVGLVAQAHAQLLAKLDGTRAAPAAEQGGGLWAAIKRLFGGQKPPPQHAPNRLPAEWHQPIDGAILPLSAVPDPAFAQGAIGIGFAINPAGGTVRSPVKGKLSAIYPSKHALGITADNGLEMLIHIGIDSVALKGEGFRLLAGVNSRVEAGQPLLEVDWEHLRQHIPSLISPVVFPELDAAQWQIRLDGQTVALEGGSHE